MPVREGCAERFNSETRLVRPPPAEGEEGAVNAVVEEDWFRSLVTQGRSRPWVWASLKVVIVVDGGGDVGEGSCGVERGIMLDRWTRMGIEAVFL